MGWLDGDPHNQRGCLAAVLLNIAIPVGLAVIFFLVCHR